MTDELTQPRIATLPLEGEAVPLNIFRTLSRNPALSDAFISLGGHLLRRGLLPKREREIVILRVGWRSGSEYEFGQHTVIGKAAGVTDAEIARLADCGTGEWGEADRVLVAMVDDLCDNNMVSTETWRALADQRDEAELLELLVLAGYYRLVSGMLNSVGVALEPATPGWPEGAKPVRRAPRQAAT